MTKNEKERNSIFAIPLLYNAGSAVCIKVVSVMELLSAIKTGICIIFLLRLCWMLGKSIYLRNVEAFRFINKCGRDSGLGWSLLFYLMANS